MTGSDVGLETVVEVDVVEDGPEAPFVVVVSAAVVLDVVAVVVDVVVVVVVVVVVIGRCPITLTSSM